MLILTYIERRKDVDNVSGTSGLIILTSHRERSLERKVYRTDVVKKKRR